MIDMLDYAEYLNKIYDKKGFQGIIELVKGELEYGNVSFRNGLYCITTGGWSDDESLVHALISPVCRFHYHYCGYIVGGAFFFVEDKDCKNDVEMLNTMNQRYYKVVADNLGEYSILTNDDILLVTEIQDRVIAGTVNEELNCIAVNADYHRMMHEQCKKDSLALLEQNEKLKEENQHLRQILDLGQTDAKGVVNVLNMQQEKIRTILKENKELKHENVNIMSDLDYFRTKNGSLEEGLFKKDRCIVKLEEETQQLKDLIVHMGYTIKNENGIITLELKR